jgi:hypothetical protein
MGHLSEEGWRADVRGAYISFPAAEVKQFRDGLCQAAPVAVTLHVMHSGPTLRLRPSTSARLAHASVAVARAWGSNVGAKAKKQPLI